MDNYSVTTTPERSAPSTGLPTERLQLDPISSAEVDALIIQSRLPGWAADFPQPTDHDAARQFFEQGLNSVAEPLTTRFIRERDTAAVVGTIGFLILPEEGDVEVSYSVVPSRRGRGYATEALIAMARQALEQPEVSRVIAHTEVENAASQSLLLSAGFLPVEVPGLDLGFVLRRAQLPEASL
ncbi:RimJ/RimL family protein N-acetyltransferase [Arthrobacter sp. UYP6]|uniref:GNAT family N-acetyltransferase n=1 Tax=Arthrobacter sp. UYP6 TaxID=1756378 RepID=UPI0033990DDF